MRCITWKSISEPLYFAIALQAAQEMKDLYAAVANMANEFNEPELEGNHVKARYDNLVADMRYMMSQQPWW